MGKNIVRVAGGFAAIAAIAVPLLNSDIPKTLSHWDSNTALILSHLGVPRPPEHVWSYVWANPWIALSFAALVFILGVVALSLIQKIWAKVFHSGADALHLPHSSPGFADLQTGDARDVGLRKAWGYIICGRWGQDFTAVALDHVHDLWEPWKTLHQKARDGDIQIWGKPQRNGGIYERIRMDFWEMNRPKYPALLNTDEAPHTEPSGGDGLPQYWDLMVSKKQFEREWPWTIRMKMRRDFLRLKVALTSS